VYPLPQHRIMIEPIICYLLTDILFLFFLQFIILDTAGITFYNHVSGTSWDRFGVVRQMDSV